VTQTFFVVQALAVSGLFSGTLVVNDPLARLAPDDPLAEIASRSPQQLAERLDIQYELVSADGRPVELTERREPGHELGIRRFTHRTFSAARGRHTLRLLARCQPAVTTPVQVTDSTEVVDLPLGPPSPQPMIVRAERLDAVPIHGADRWTVARGGRVTLLRDWPDQATGACTKAIVRLDQVNGAPRGKVAVVDRAALAVDANPGGAAEDARRAEAAYTTVLEAVREFAKLDAAGVQALADATRRAIEHLEALGARADGSVRASFDPKTGKSEIDEVSLLGPYLGALARLQRVVSLLQELKLSPRDLAGNRFVDLAVTLDREKANHAWNGTIYPFVSARLELRMHAPLGCGDPMRLGELRFERPPCAMSGSYPVTYTPLAGDAKVKRAFEGAPMDYRPGAVQFIDAVKRAYGLAQLPTTVHYLPEYGAVELSKPRRWGEESAPAARGERPFTFTPLPRAEPWPDLARMPRSEAQSAALAYARAWEDEHRREALVNCAVLAQHFVVAAADELVARAAAAQRAADEEYVRDELEGYAELRAPLFASSACKGRPTGTILPGTLLRVEEGIRGDAKRREIEVDSCLRVSGDGVSGWIPSALDLDWSAGAARSSESVPVLSKQVPGSQSDAARSIENSTSVYLTYRLTADARRRRGVLDADGAEEMAGQAQSARVELCTERARYRHNYGAARLAELDRLIQKGLRKRRQGESLVRLASAACKP
jgi:hypothetical protein